MPKYKIQAQHTVYLTYVVEAKGFKEALDKLCGREIFTTWSNGELFGPCVAYTDDIEVDWEEGFHYDSDPSPTGRQHVSRDWEWDVVCSECGESTGHWEENISLCDDCAPEKGGER
jgi:hypothetical protein